MPLARPRAMRRPVKEPGPMETAIASRSRSVMPAWAVASWTSAGSDAVWERSAWRWRSARTVSSRTIPTAAVQVAVSRPRTSSDSALHEAMDVVEEHEHHQREEQHDTDLLRDLARARR